MNKFISLFLSVLLATPAYAGRLQNADFKTLAELTAAGGTSAELLNDTKLYLTNGSLQKQLSAAISDGSLFNTIQPLTTKGDVLTRTSSAATRLAVGSDGTALVADSTQATGLRWGAVAGSGGAGKNYISNPDAAYNAAGYSAYQDAAGSTPVDGTGGTPTVTIARVTSGLLLSTDAEFSFTKPASNVQGQGFSVDFTIDPRDKAKVHQIKFDYQVASGTFAAGGQGVDSDVEFFIYDVTNATVIQPSTYKLFSNSATLAGTFLGNFQTASNSVSYRLIGHVATPSALAYNLRFKGIQVGPTQISVGTVITDWVRVGPVPIRATTTNPQKGVVVIDDLWERRVGSNAEYRLIYVQSSNAGASNGAGDYLFDIPRKIDTSIVIPYTTISSTDAQTGLVQSIVSATLDNSQSVNGVVRVYGESTVRLATFTGTSAGYITAGNYQLGFGALSYQATFSVPIQGWKVQQQTSDLNDQRIVAARYYAGGTSGSSGAGVPCDFAVKDYDTHSAVTTGAGVWKFTAPISGIYRVGGNMYGGGSADIKLYKNGTLYSSIGNQTAGTVGSLSASVQLNAGDYIDIRGTSAMTFAATTGGTSANSNFVTIERVANPAQISATETIAARYITTAGAAISANTITAVTFPTKTFDTHGSWDGSKYVAPASGLYNVKAVLTFVNGATSTLRCLIYKNGVVYSDQWTVTGSAPGYFWSAPCDDEIRLNAGEYVEIKTWSDQARSFDTDPSRNYVSITKEGI